MNPGLANWVQRIREEWRRGKMSIAKYRELVRLGFRFVNPSSATTTVSERN